MSIFKKGVRYFFGPTAIIQIHTKKENPDIFKASRLNAVASIEYDGIAWVACVGWVESLF